MDLEISKIEDIEKLIVDLTYDGFNSKEIRDEFERRKGTFSDLVICLIAYAKIGNNPKKLNEKIKNLETGKSVLDVMVRLGINNSSDGVAKLTLSRLALAFMPVYLSLRISIKDKLEENELTDRIISDICFCGCEMIYDSEGYEDFHKMFSRSISDIDYEIEEARSDHRRPMSYVENLEKKYQENYVDWLKVMTRGFESDTTIKDKVELIFTSYMENDLIINFDSVRLCYESMLGNNEITIENKAITMLISQRSEEEEDVSENNDEEQSSTSANKEGADDSDDEEDGEIVQVNKGSKKQKTMRTRRKPL
jgi:hypothetical protein